MWLPHCLSAVHVNCIMQPLLRQVAKGPSESVRLLTSWRCHAAAEITMFDDVIVVYKFFGDLMFFVTGSQDENELILYTVLQAFYESISLLLR